MVLACPHGISQSVLIAVICSLTVDYLLLLFSALNEFLLVHSTIGALIFLLHHVFRSLLFALHLALIGRVLLSLSLSGLGILPVSQVYTFLEVAVFKQARLLAGHTTSICDTMAACHDNLVVHSCVVALARSNAPLLEEGAGLRGDRASRSPLAHSDRSSGLTGASSASVLREILVEVGVNELLIILALVALVHLAIGAHWHVLCHAAMKVYRFDLFLALVSDGRAIGYEHLICLRFLYSLVLGIAPLVRGQLLFLVTRRAPLVDEVGVRVAGDRFQILRRLLLLHGRPDKTLHIHTVLVLIQGLLRGNFLDAD